MHRKILAFTLLFGYASALVDLYKQCGGLNYYGDKDCGAGRKCVYMNDFWWDCKLESDNSGPIVELYKQCGGDGYKGNNNCGPGRKCVYVNQWWYECKEDSSVIDNGSGGGGGGGGGSIVSTNGAQRFLKGKFKHGRLYDPAKLKDNDYDNFDYITIWLGTIDKNTDFNIYYQGLMIDLAKRKNKIPA